MAKKQRPSEGETPLAGFQDLPPPVALQRGYDGPPLTQGDGYVLTDPREIADANRLFDELQQRAQLPTLHGYGMTQAFTRGDKWVVYRCSTSGDIEMLTPKGKAGVIVGESKPSAAGRLTSAIREAYT